jgi:hypothetical protein
MGSCTASLGFAWQRNLVSDNHTSFREHFSHNENCGDRAADRGYGYKSAQVTLNRNDLGG